MRTPLEARIGELRGRVRRLLALHGLSWVVVGATLTIIAAGLLDWLVPGHLAREVRLVLLLGVIGLAGWLLVRYVFRPLVVRFRDLDIALRIETRWPGLNDRLVSTIQFLRMPGRGGDRDDILGSQALREATIRQTLAEVEGIDFRQAVDPRPARRAALAAAGSLALGAILILAAPTLSRIAVSRLFDPFGGHRWPQRTHLAIVGAPAKVAKGEEFRLEVAVAPGDHVPSTAKATYRFDDGHIEVEALRSDDRGHFHGRREAVAGSFLVSVAGGDDVTPPRRVTVVPPPKLEQITVRLIPPPYTGLASQTLAPQLTEFPAVRGTKVEVSARANKPIATAALRLGDGSAALRVSRSGDGRALAAAFTVAESGPFWFDLKDAEGFRAQGQDTVRFEVRALRDEEPRVVIDDPAADRDVTAKATVPVAITADDDYGLGLVRLLYKVAPGGSEPSAEKIVPLWAVEKDQAPVKRKDVPYLWDLSSLNLTPGAIITFHADARDLDAVNPKGPKTGKSRELRLRIATPEEIARQLEDAQRDIREAIQRVLDMEKQAQTPVQEAQRALEKLDRLDKAARDDLANAGVIQGQVRERVTNKADGLDQKIGRYLEDLKNLKIDNPEAQKQMEQMQEGVRRIRDNHLGPAEQGLTRASKALDDPATAPDPERPTTEAESRPNSQPRPQAAKDAPRPAPSKSEAPSQPAGEKGQAAQEPPKPDGSKDQPNGSPSPQAKAARDDLAESAEHQAAIADELGRMLDSLKQFDTVRGVVQDAKTLLKNQEDAMKQAAEAAAQPDMAGKTPDDLSSEQKVGLGNLGARQAELAKGLEALENKMDDLSRRLDESDPLAASSLRDSAAQSRQKGTASKMSESAGQLEKNQMGAAQQNQKQAQEDLKRLIDELQHRREHELSRLVKELKNAENDLKSLRDRQTKNQQQTAQAGQNKNAQERKAQLEKLAKEQQEIQKELKKQLQRLQKLRADAAAQAGSKASGKMSKAQQDQENDDAEGAQQQQDDALADLDDARDELKKARQEAEEQLAMEQLSKMADSLKALSEQQDKLVVETADYQAKQAGGSKLSRSQAASVRGLGRAQSAIRDETTGLAERLDQAPVFQLTLKRASDSMEVAVGRLQELKTDDDTQFVQRSASKRFKQLLDALKPDPAEPGGKPPGGDGGEGSGGGGGGDGITTAAQIKMLKALQQELNERTEELDTLRLRNKSLSPQQEQELARLHDDQRHIADLTLDLTKPKRDDGEED